MRPQTKGLSVPQPGGRYDNKVEVWDYKQVGKLISLYREMKDRWSRGAQETEVGRQLL